MTAPCATPIAGIQPVGLSTFYIGKPGVMSKLRIPDAGYASGMTRGEIEHNLPGGGVTVTRRANVKRTWTLPFSGMTPDELDVLVSYYAGARGLGPFCLIDPAFRNQLGLSASTMDAAKGTNTVWNPATADTAPIIDTTVAPALPGSAVLRWKTPVNTHYLFQGTQPGGVLTPDVSRAVPYLSDQSAVVSMYAKTASSTASVALHGLGVESAGWDGTSDVNGGTKTLTTAYQRLVTVVPVASFAGSIDFLCAALQSKAAGSPDILISNVQIEYGVSAATPWVTGLGVARVSLTAGMPNTMQRYWRRSSSITAAEN